MYLSFGNGHKSVANYIEKYFRDNSNNYEIVSIDLLDYSTPIIGDFNKILFNFLLLKAPFLWNFIYNIFNSRAYIYASKFATIFLKSKKFKKIITEFNPDIVISTHYFGSALIELYTKKKTVDTKLITIAEDDKSIIYWTLEEEITAVQEQEINL